ncbi:MAG: hypothetical protein AAFR58_16305 [Cyanobacteria bacterium J06627_28]
MPALLSITPEVNLLWSGETPRRFAALGNAHQDRSGQSIAKVEVGSSIKTANLLAD